MLERHRQQNFCYLFRFVYFRNYQPILGLPETCLTYS